METLYANIVATVALLISLASAGWAAYRHFRWARPVIKVSGTQWTQLSPWSEALRAGFSIDVTNIGDQATQITNAYWQLARGDGTDFRVTSRSDNSLESRFAPADPGLRPAPEFPFDLERYQSKGWDFVISTDGWLEPHEIKRARIIVEYTSRESREVARGDWEDFQLGLETTRRQDKGL